jgi:multiple sugar transport system substrate-binding protein
VPSVEQLAGSRAKQQAAWRFVKFACGPQGTTMMVKATAYMPATSTPASREDRSREVYQQNPPHLISIGHKPGRFQLSRGRQQ